MAFQFSPRSFSAVFRVIAGVCSLGASAHASPVMIAGDGSEKVHSTQVSILKQEGVSVVSVMPDYQGSLTPFSLIMPVPEDVALEQVTTLKREFMGRLDSLSAPKFAEFWEMDPCDPGEVQQEWERDMTAHASTGFLGTVDTGNAPKVAKELLMDMKAQEKKGEYQFSVMTADEVKAHVQKRKLALPAGGEANLDAYSAKGFKFVVADVETGRVELMGGSRAQLSPIRFWTASDYSSVPARFGLPSAAKMQELLIYTLVPERRMQVKNYDTKAAPTNLAVSFDVKERMGEFYSGIHDRFLEKHPNTFLLEYAFPSWECGKPCTNDPLLPHEILSLGGEVYEAKLPEDVRRPKPEPATDEEKAKFEATLEGKKPKEKVDAKKQWEADREEIAARRGILARHKYVFTRLHYRYSGSTLPQDPELGPGAAIRGGVELPKGEGGPADTSVSAAPDNAMQTRFNHMHPDISVLKCDNPTRYRWGKPPRSYRGLNKIWIAEDLSRKKRDKFQLNDVVITPVPDLDIAGKAALPAVAPAPVVAPQVEEKKGMFGCDLGGVPLQSGASLGGLSVLAALLGRRRRSRSSR